MFSKIFTIAKGNKTLIAWDCPKDQRSSYVQNNLGNSIEQIGFVNEYSIPAFEMMGGEFSLNGTLAYSSTLKPSSEFLASGLSSKVLRISEAETAIRLELPFKQIDNVVLFEGIGYILLEDDEEVATQLLSGYCNKYSLPAFGALIYKDGVMYPNVYVHKTDSLISETACGSGSVAISILKSLSEVKQPSGGIIYINKNNSIFTITAEVSEIY